MNDDIKLLQAEVNRLKLRVSYLERIARIQKDLLEAKQKEVWALMEQLANK